MSRPKARPPDFLTTKGRYDHNHHVTIFDEMIDSPAFTALSHGAKAVYILILKEFRGGFTGNKVVCPYSTMIQHGVRKESIPNWLTELSALGFIRIESNGGMYRIPNKYLLTNEWTRYKTIEQANEAKSAALKARKEKKPVSQEK